MPTIDSENMRIMGHTLSLIPYSWKIWGGINLVVLVVYATAKLKTRSYLHIHMATPYQTANLNLPIFLKWRFGAEPPNLIPANISSYTVGIFLENYR